MIGSSASWSWWSRGLSAVLAVLLLGSALRARAAEPEAPSKEFLEYLGTIEAEDDDWTLFDSNREPAEPQDPPSPPKKEPSPTPQPGEEP